MGVSGTGKTSVAHRIRDTHQLSFAEGDDLHPPSNIEKMSAGIPLTDTDRTPWLRLIADWMNESARAGQNTVVTCSALKRSYRDLLRTAQGRVVFIHLAGDFEVIAQRMGERKGHFMPVSLLQNQFDTLELLQDDEDGVVIDVAGTKEAVKQAAAEAVGSYLP